MDHELIINNKRIIVNQEQFNRINEICNNSQDTKLTTIDLHSIMKYAFFVKNYQRGYRWTATEIEELLSDIESIDEIEDGYCMQPLVVKKVPKFTAQKQLSIQGLEEVPGTLSDDTYELLDGQQRLSTLALILSFLCSAINFNFPSFVIYYELTRKTDEHYLNKAKDIIFEWFAKSHIYNENKTYSGRQKKNTTGVNWNKDSLSKFFSKINKLFFIWYEVDYNASSEKVFKNINEGKIELTNAELFKALLLNPDNIIETESTSNLAQLQQIAFEWDKIESGLRDDDFWFFLSKEDVEKSLQKSRIDYIIEVFARTIITSGIDLDENKDRFSFLTIQNYLKEKNNNFETIKKAWEDIVKVYDKLYSWYKDQELYHTIGFLVASEEKNRGSKAVVSPIVVEIYNKCNNKTINDVKKYVRKRISEYIFGEPYKELNSKNIKYAYEEETIVSKSKLKNILLLTNIFALLKFNEDGLTAQESIRFPFRIYHNPDEQWDIEHIEPCTLEKDLNKCKDFESFISTISLLNDKANHLNDKTSMEDTEIPDKDKKIIKSYLNENPNSENYKAVSGYRDCCRIWSEYAESENQTPGENCIFNLVLLNASINRSYGNAFFVRKRERIKEEDKNGLFIPICTRNVFMKYFSSSLDDSPNQWTTSDMDSYGEWIDKMLSIIREWGK